MFWKFVVILVLCCSHAFVDGIHEAFRRDSGHPQWHHNAFHDIEENVRHEMRQMLHSRAEIPFHVPLEINIVLVGFNNDGGYRYKLDAQSLEEFLRKSFPSHHPACVETGLPLDIEHDLHYNVIPVGQPELISFEKELKKLMVPGGTARETDTGREVPLFEVEATKIEKSIERLYNYLFAIDENFNSASDLNVVVPSAIFIINCDKVRMDPRNTELNLDSLTYAKIDALTREQLEEQEGNYIYQYRYNGGGASQVWIGAGRYAVIDLSAGPCIYGMVETEEGSISARTVPRLRHVLFPNGHHGLVNPTSTHEYVIGQLGALISTTIEHILVPDVRFETVDLASRLLIPVIVLHNHNQYDVLRQGHNYSIDINAIENEVKKMIFPEQDVMIIAGSYSLHEHEKLAIAVSKALRAHSIHETKPDGRFHVRTKTYLDGSILREEMERSADVLAAGLLEVANPDVSNKFYLKQSWMLNTDPDDSVIKSRPAWVTFSNKHKKDKRQKSNMKKQSGDLLRTYGTRVVPVFVLSLAGVDPELLMEGESQVWTSNDVVIVLQHNNDKIPLSYVSGTQRMYAVPWQAQRHIIAGLSSVVGGLAAPYEKASHIHRRPVSNWLWATGCHPFGPFSNVSKVSQLLQDTALRTTIYARVDAALHKIRDAIEEVQTFANEHLKTPLGEPVKGERKKSTPELWLDKFYKKKTNLPEPFPHELVERLENYLNNLEEEFGSLAGLLYDHHLEDANRNSSEIFQNTIFTLQYVQRVLISERDKMRCCSVVYEVPVRYSQAFVYGGILIAGFIVYFLVIFFSSPER